MNNMKSKYDKYSDERIVELLNGLRNRLLSTNKIYIGDDNELIMQTCKRMTENIAKIKVKQI